MVSGPPGDPSVGTRVHIRSRLGMDMQAEFVQVMPPHRAAVKMVDGPWFLARFTGSWIFQEINPHATTARFRYTIVARPAVLRFVIETAAAWYFSRVVEKRLAASRRTASAMGGHRHEGAMHGGKQFDRCIGNRRLRAGSRRRPVCRMMGFLALARPVLGKSRQLRSTQYGGARELSDGRSGAVSVVLRVVAESLATLDSAEEGEPPRRWWSGAVTGMPWPPTLARAAHQCIDCTLTAVRMWPLGRS